MDKFVYIITDYREYDCFAVIDDSLLDDLKYLISKCYNNGKVALEIEYTKFTNIAVDSHYFFWYQLQDMCFGKDDSDFDEPERIKDCLRKLGKYYGVVCQYDFEDLV